MLFSEPTELRTKWLGWDEPKVHWLTECSHPDAALSRAVINEWYQGFPDNDGRFAQRLRSEVDVDHQQALDELFVYRVLRRLHDDVRYEENGVGPDFRVYERTTCILAVEVATLFLRADWNEVQKRHNRLADEVNSRLRPTQGYFIDFEIEAAPNDPAPRHFADWLEKQVVKLPPHTTFDGSDSGIATASYERKGTRINVRFMPMRADAATRLDPDSRIVGFGPRIAGFVNSGTRLRDAIGKKGGDRYDIRGIPYVVAVGNRDPFLSDDVVIDSLYGSEGIRIDRHDDSMFSAIRRNDGLFGIDPTRRQARHRRISAVALFSSAAVQDVASSDIAVYDNLSPASKLADRQFPATRRFGQVRADGRFGWRPT